MDGINGVNPEDLSALLADLANVRDRDASKKLREFDIEDGDWIDVVGTQLFRVSVIRSNGEIVGVDAGMEEQVSKILQRADVSSHSKHGYYAGKKVAENATLADCDYRLGRPLRLCSGKRGCQCGRKGHEKKVKIQCKRVDTDDSEEDTDSDDSGSESE